MRPSSKRSSTRVDARGAADLLQLVVGEPEDPELALLVEALADHLLVALLEDVERHELAGQQHEAEREQGKALDLQSPCSKASSPATSTALLWLTRDLRVHDHPALCAALEERGDLVPVFCFDSRLLNGRHASSPAPSFMLECLCGARRAAGRDRVP